MQLLGIDITRSIYSQIECGTYNIKVTELAALHLIFDVDYNAFFENIEIVKPSSNDEKILKYTGYYPHKHKPLKFNIHHGFIKRPEKI